MLNLDSLFRTNCTDRDKFLARLFGIFNEEIVRIWCDDDRSKYRDVGRPTIYFGSNSRGRTVDFCLEEKELNKRFVAEMKCEMQYENYKYLTLESHSQLLHHKSTTFAAFLSATANPRDTIVKVKRKETKIDGGILVWGKTTESGKSAVIKKYGFKDVLSLEQIIRDLLQWKNSKFILLLENRAEWCNHLFQGLRQKDF